MVRDVNIPNGSEALWGSESPESQKVERVGARFIPTRNAHARADLLAEGHIVTRVPTLDDVLDLEGDKLLDHKLEGLGKDRETILIGHE